MTSFFDSYLSRPLTLETAVETIVTKGPVFFALWRGEGNFVSTVLREGTLDLVEVELIGEVFIYR